MSLGTFKPCRIRQVTFLSNWGMSLTSASRFLLQNTSSKIWIRMAKFNAFWCKNLKNLEHVLFRFEINTIWISFKLNFCCFSSELFLRRFYSSSPKSAVSSRLHKNNGGEIYWVVCFAVDDFIDMSGNWLGKLPLSSLLCLSIFVKMVATNRLLKPWQIIFSAKN